MAGGRGPRVALVTGASQGLGAALAESLADRGWRLVLDARRADRLRAVEARLAARTKVIAIPGDVTDPEHRERLVAAVRGLGPLELLVNNASTLGASPLPQVGTVEPDTLRRIYDVNVVAPAALVRDFLPALVAARGTIVNITSDAAVEAYPGWGGYGSSKAALEQLSRILAEEEPRVRVLLVDPGDMRTEMHQDAFPGEDISDRADPRERVAGLLALVEGDQGGGRYRVEELAEP